MPWHFPNQIVQGCQGKSHTLSEMHFDTLFLIAISSKIFRLKGFQHPKFWIENTA